MRASDAEREQIVALLRTAAAEGRLDVDELDERTATAYAAKTRGELTRLIADLPTAHLPATQPRGRWKLPQRNGRGAFSSYWRAPVRQRQAAGDVMRFVSPSMRAYGYRLEYSTDQQISFVRDHTPVWTYFVAVLVFPIGLLALLYKEQDRVTIELADHGDSTAITASGTAPLAIRRAMTAMQG
ncbi:uncharacterized protein DUF1707 [Solirubrobacter pauli]|uniref:Uncharacterized protein DUF1707 n=1 Tax=Solirubrobacter pauli TaxID=166793 RepID=A0A660L7F5_9ACTN|nr:DUF1707 domain-containing protein [Solirubrobacter pauli]RKQ90952.1 uncharacterized protein DUF1707 [Solirubrobacter pauli]